MHIEYEEPKYGVNYRRGDTFGTNVFFDLIHGGIAHFQRWDRMDGIWCQHVGIVVDEHTAIQAHIKEGVHTVSIHDMFEDPRTQIFFREPVGLTDELADRIVGTAMCHLGEEYDRGLIVSHALVGTFMGRLANKATDGLFEELLARGFDDPNEWICSELVADAMDTQPEYKDKGILADSNATINPQELIQDNVIYKPWKDQ